MPTVLITGAGRGLGLEFARQYALNDWKVIATCWQAEMKEELDALEGDVSFHTLDVRDFDRIDELARELDGQPIDLLINNAALYGPEDGNNLGCLDYDAWADAFRVNAMAPIKLAEAFRSHVAKSYRKTMVGISSRMASIADNTAGGVYAYRTSKSAMNSALHSLAIDLYPDGVSVYMLHPGWTRTSIGGPLAFSTPEDSVDRMRRLLEKLTIEQTGRFLNFDGTVVPW